MIEEGGKGKAVVPDPTAIPSPEKTCAGVGGYAAQEEEEEEDGIFEWDETARAWAYAFGFVTAVGLAAYWYDLRRK